MTAATFTIGNRTIGPGHPPYIIAEVSGNHNGDINRALEIIDAAHAAGADAVKLQTYTPDTMTIDCDLDDFQVKGGLWDGRTLYELYEEAHTPWEWHEQLFARAHKLGLDIFSTPFDETSVAFLQQFNMGVYKIASFELTDHALIRKVAATGKPIIMSTGMASVEEIEESVAVAHESGCKDLCLLYCVSGYPTPVTDANLLTMPKLQEKFNVVSGFSDHTPGTAVSVAAVSLGANIIEKHFTLRRSDGGPDAAFSLEPDELGALVADCRTAWKALGEAQFRRKTSEKANLIFRRSVYVVKNMEKGEVFTHENTRVIRPGYGLAPKEHEVILGKKAKAAIARGTALTLDKIQ